MRSNQPHRKKLRRERALARLEANRKIYATAGDKYAAQLARIDHDMEILKSRIAAGPA